LQQEFTYFYRMSSVLDQIEQYKQEIASIVPNGAEALESYRIRFLGTKGIVKNLFAEMKNVPPESKKEFGQVLNEFKQLAEAKYQDWKNNLGGATEKAVSIDLSLPGDPVPLGTHHPITLVRDQIVHIFGRLGFSVAEGPEIEDDWHNFTALNLPEDHPARDMQDTFYVHQHPDWLLRTHTSRPSVSSAPAASTATRLSAPEHIVFSTRPKACT
jgi:phenylalanyl-tRNA synthetase alpha chain